MVCRNNSFSLSGVSATHVFLSGCTAAINQLQRANRKLTAAYWRFQFSTQTRHASKHFTAVLVLRKNQPRLAFHGASAELRGKRQIGDSFSSNLTMADTEFT